MSDLEALKAALIDRYDFVRELGRGGFAVVYLARDLRHDRDVAFKVMHDEVAQSVGRDRFEREIKLVARLQHPHILGVFDSGETGGRLWFTMPFIDGQTLRSRLDRERQLPLGDAITIAREVADALDYAHRHGVIHRDVKPDNILLAERHALVADFGIARAVTSGGDTPALTMTGMGIGTPGYMSPEQAMGGIDVDARTDVYALGCIVYQMLSGEPPFAGATPQAVIARVLTENPRPLATTRPGLPPMLEPVLRKAMSRVSADRYTTVAEFADALAQATVNTQAPATRRRFSQLAIFGIGLFIGLGGLFAWRNSQSGVIDKTPGLAVLPFESEGTADDVAFADGMTEELRGKLAGVPGLRVIARTSSNQYRATKKSPRQIGDELGVQYLLTGTVRWSSGADGVRRVRVTPELSRTSDGATRWQAPFDENLKDIFAMQSSIASKVATELDIALGAATREQLAARPTDDVSAYREFLLGESATEALGKNDRVSSQNGLAHYERAIALDSGYASAWARIASIHLGNAATNYSNEEADAGRHALARANSLAPNATATVIARARAASVLDKAYLRAAAILDSAVKRTPSDVLLLSQLAGYVATLSRWDEAVTYSRRAAELDPRNPTVLARYARILHGTRRFAACDSVLVRALALSPGNISTSQSRVINLLSTGDTATASRVIRETLRLADTTAFLAYYAQYQEMMWVLPIELQKRVTTLTPGAFTNNRQQWALKVGRQWLILGDLAKARAYGDTAVAIARTQLADNAKDAQIYELLARSLALAGQSDEAVAYADKALKLRDTEEDATTGNYVRYQAARVYIQSGAYDKALDLIEPLMTGYYSELTPAWLRLEPVFRPLRGNPRFERLIAVR